mmetsp:Transcript_30608/g.55405  ORF Transcript_30608/g.55405 Transcript_30608/m.55405 type:complete len:295 (-) Transcript_30608:100-984(-)
MRLSVALISLATVASGYTVAPSAPSSTAHRRSVKPIFMSDPGDAPSDTSSDDVFTVTATTVTPTKSPSLVNSMLSQLELTKEISDEKRAAINEACLALEKTNPTENPAMSPLLNGVWELRYAAGYEADWALPSPTRQLALFLYSGGYSPGVFALNLANQLPSVLVDVGDLEISISRDQPRVEAKVSIQMANGALESDVCVTARLEVESGVRLRETYERANVMDQNIDIPAQLQYSRDLYVTYVDEDIMIVRDASGVPEVLVRKQKQFSNNWGNNPGELDDDSLTAPGEDVPATD